MKKNEIIYGFVNEGLVEGDHYEYGGYSGIEERPIINESGNWEPYVPLPEKQSSDIVFFDSRNCSNYGTNNPLETLAFFLGFNDFPRNLSERYSGVMTGTSETGNDPHKVIELIRKTVGGIPEEALPFDEKVRTREEYYHPDPMTLAYIRLGEQLVKKFDIKHEWVFNDRDLKMDVGEKQERLKTGLKRGTIALSVKAWSKNKKGLYKKNRKEKDNHWVQLLSCKPGKSWRVYDHYDKFIKDLEWDYNFECAKIYYMSRREESNNSLIRKLDELFAQLTTLLSRLGNTLGSWIRS